MTRPETSCRPATWYHSLMITEPSPAGVARSAARLKAAALPVDRKGRDLAPVVVALTEWGDRWAAPDGPPVVFGHPGCDGLARQTVVCTSCGNGLPASKLEARPTVRSATG